MSYVRTATLSDAEEMASIEKDIFDEDRRLISEGYYRFRVGNATLENYLSDLRKKESIFIVAIESDKLLGIARGIEHSGGVLNMEFIGVKKESRKKSIGSKLIKEVEDEAKKRGLHKIIFQIYPDPVYTSFFENIGYNKEATLKKHYFHQDIELFTKFLY